MLENSNSLNSLCEKDNIIRLKTISISNSPETKYKVIVSLTSYPARIATVNQTIESILAQTIKADKVILWLAPEQFPNKEKDLPQQLLDLIPRGLTIDWYHDIKSYKKLIPTLIKYPNDIIITTDDDLIYDKEWLEKLYMSYLKYPNDINCHRARRIVFDRKHNIKRYNEWKFISSDSNTSYVNFFTGAGGILYPQNCFHKDILNEEKFTKLCPTADDIWFWTMAVLNGKKIRVVRNNILSLKYIPGTQGNSLWSTNKQGANDVQMQNMLIEYPQLMPMLQEAAKETKVEDIKNEYKNYTFLEIIFSIKNERCGNFKVFKVICILGIKIKIRCKRLENKN